MPRELYLRPLGFLHGATAAAAVSDGQAGWIAGGPVAFAHVEIIEGRPGATTRRTASYGACAAMGDTEIAELLGKLSARRAPLAGMSLDRPRIMGIVNVTPDSFSDGGLYDETEAAIAHAGRLSADGADILDIGGESTRPGAATIDAAVELDRVAPVVQGLSGTRALLSIDSRKPRVWAAAAEAGAHIINDVSALSYTEDSVAAAVDLSLPVILMHARGDPRSMQDDPRYDDVLLEVFDYLEDRIAACLAAGMRPEAIVADPGIGFGKTLAHNLELLAGIGLLHGLGVPLLLGASRKTFVGSLSEVGEPGSRACGSVAAALAGAAQGVQLLRVHDVVETRQALAVWGACLEGRPQPKPAPFRPLSVRLV